MGVQRVGQRAGGFADVPVGRRIAGIADSGAEPETVSGFAGGLASRGAASNDAEQLCGDGEDERALKGECPSHFGAQGADLPVEVGFRLLA